MKKLITILVGIVLAFSCKTQYIPVPATTSTTVNVKDSIAWNIKDSVRITEKSRYKDFGDLLKPLEIDGSHSHMRSWVDTTNNILVGTLEEDEIKEKTRIEYRDRVVYKDSVRTVETPVPYEVEKPVPYIPKFWKIMGWIGITSILIAIGLLGFKIYQLKKSGFKNLINFKNLKIFSSKDIIE